MNSGKTAFASSEPDTGFKLQGNPLDGTRPDARCPAAAGIRHGFSASRGRKRQGFEPCRGAVSSRSRPSHPSSGALKRRMNCVSRSAVPARPSCSILKIGKGTRQHALIAGKTGSGKSTLFHVIITNLALWCSPEQVEFYLVDFKKAWSSSVTPIAGCLMQRSLPSKATGILAERAGTRGRGVAAARRLVPTIGRAGHRRLQKGGRNRADAAVIADH